MSTPLRSKPRGGETVHDTDFDVSDWSKDIDPPVEPLTREEAQALLARHPSMSVWQVLAAQLGFGVLIALIWGGVSRDASALWSSLYATAVVVVPGLLMARGVFGQLIYVSWDFNMVVVKLSSWPDFVNPKWTVATLEAVREIGKHLNPRGSGRAAAVPSLRSRSP